MKIIFICMFFLSYFFVYAQVFTSESEKYWYYRDRLDYFVYPGNQEGNSIIVTNRNANRPYGYSSSGWRPGIYNSVEFGQTFKSMGYYIGLLATEYRLLQQNNQDVSETLQELNFAMDALIRLDNCEGNEPWNQESSYFDGFYVRNDVPPVLSDNMTDYLNQSLPNFTTWSEYQNYILQYKGRPFPINKFNVFCTRQYQSVYNYKYIFPDDDFDLMAYNYTYLDNGITYWKHWKNGTITSNDENVGIYMGLALVAKLVDDSNVKMKAIEISKRILEFAILDPRASGMFDHVVDNQTNFNRFGMRYPDLEEISSGNGGKTIGVIMGMITAFQKINHAPYMSNSLSFQSIIAANYVYSHAINSLSVLVGPLPFILTLNPPFFSPITIKFMHEYDRGMFCKLLAISNYSSNNKAYKSITMIGDDNNWETFYLLLWAVINDYNLNDKKFNYPFFKLISDLATAPCSGPYCYGSDFSPGWSNQYKYDASLYGQFHGGDKLGVFPGIDYMLLYNLACLAFPDGFDYEGQHYDFPYYVNQNNRVVTTYYPYLSSYNGGTYYGSMATPEEIKAISTIRSSMKVLNQALNPTDLTYIPGVYGDVTLKAGESIILQDGFRVDAGAHFLARIESYSCNGLPYKNMEAPPWGENYRGCFYDTLVSIPMDKRAPMVYTDDNYEEEDFDMPLWDDYFYTYDTTATPELVVGAWLNPNPCQSTTTLTLVSETDQFVTIELFDVNGQKRETVFEGNTDLNLTQSIDMNTYAEGVYILRLTGSSGTKVIRLVKE